MKPAISTLGRNAKARARIEAKNLVGYMVPGEGDRDDSCLRYRGCIEVAAAHGGDWKCPTACERRTVS